jgi:hypothetical protein
MAATGHSTMVSAALLLRGRRHVPYAGAPHRAGARRPRPPSCLCEATSASSALRARGRTAARASGSPLVEAPRAGRKQGQYPQNGHHPAAVASVRRRGPLGSPELRQRDRFAKRAAACTPRRQQSLEMRQHPPGRMWPQRVWGRVSGSAHLLPAACGAGLREHPDVASARVGTCIRLRAPAASSVRCWFARARRSRWPA